jgi:hypothetical protein
LHAEARRRHNNYDFHSACRLSPPVNRQLHLRVCTATLRARWSWRTQEEALRATSKCTERRCLASSREPVKSPFNNNLLSFNDKITERTGSASS